MAAKWKFGTTNLFVSDEDVSREIKRAELFTLDSTTSSFHYFGAGSTKRSLKALVVGDTDRDALLTDAAADTARTLTTPYGNVSNAKINGEPKFTAIQYAGATIDGTSYTADVTPMYTAEIELIFT